MSCALGLPLLFLPEFSKISNMEAVHPENSKQPKWAKRFLYIALGLVIVHILAVLFYFGDFVDTDQFGVKYWHISIFDLDEEESFGTWFSALILLYAGQLLWKRAKRIQETGGIHYTYWTILAIGFHMLSIDEVVGLHEWLNSALEDILWTKIAMIGVGIVGLAFIPFLIKLDPYERQWFLIAGIIYLGGAVGIETATEYYKDNDMLNTLPYNLWTCAEEALEMLGIVLFIHILEKRATPVIKQL